ncbi:MAG TPA: sigma-54 dependent transcriptional regulator [Gemmatimonadales bacterium]|nr:sigma-54 dependent transcriptional regulator [Gemmatimonadales bacterium]
MTPRARILITMDDLETAVRVNAALEGAGHRTSLLAAVDDWREELRRARPDLVVLTGGAHEARSQALARAARDQETGILILEPGMDVVAEVERVLGRRELQRTTGIAGESAAIQELLVRIEQMAPVSSTVLVQGESGTGKELVAKAIHDLSLRRGKPFIAVNCAALPESLLESELFGHEKGAFTGAAERRLGRFELADGGTIFLDEIGEIPESVQVKLLRVLESRTFFRVGGVAPIKVDVRVVAATNRSLRDQVGLGRFRDDLYYRLNVLSLYLPPLRERREDIPLLVRRFIREFSASHDRSFRGITAEAMQLLVNAPWPGNVRQLRNLVESMVVLAPGGEIRPSDIPPDILEGASRMLPVRIEGMGNGQVSNQELEFILRSLMDLRLQVEELRHRLDDGPQRVQVIDVTDTHPVAEVEVMSEGRPAGDHRPSASGALLYRPGMTMAEVERAAIEAALREHEGNRRKAAEELGIGERTLYRKLKQYGLG